MARGYLSLTTLLVFLTIAMTAVLLPVAGSAAAQDAASFTLGVDTVEASVGDTVTVDIAVDSVTGDVNPAAVEATLEWDSELIRVTNCAMVPALGWCNAEAGMLHLAAVSLNDFLVGDTIARLDVEVLELGRHDLTIAVATGYDMSGDPLDGSGRSGRVSAGNALVNGDVDCSGSMDIVDALAIAQWSVALRTDAQQCPLLSSTLQIHATEGDLNNDERTDIVDALLIAQCLVGIALRIPCPDVDTEAEAGAELATLAISTAATRPAASRLAIDDICLDGAPLGTTCVIFRNDECDGPSTCLVAEAPAGLGCPVDEIDDQCIERRAAFDGEIRCPDGSRGVPGECFIYVAKGPTLNDGSLCPLGSFEDSDAQCRKFVADAPPAPTCDEGSIAVDRIDGVWLCDYPIELVPAPCLADVPVTVLIEGSCWQVAEGEAPTPSCDELAMLDNGQCLLPESRVAAGECSLGTELRQGACVVLVEDPGYWVATCVHDQDVWGQNYGPVDGGCLFIKPPVELDCPTGFSFEDSFGGLCTRFEAAPTDANGDPFCEDPLAALNGANCVFVTDFSVLECPQDYEPWNDSPLCSILLSDYDAIGCGSDIQEPPPQDPPPLEPVVPTCYDLSGPQPGECADTEIDGDCFAVVGPFAPCGEDVACLETVAGITPVGAEERVDVNCNGTRDNGDVFAFLRFVTGDLEPHRGTCETADPLAPFLAAAADVNADRTINLLDAFLAAQCTAAEEFCV